MKKYLLTIAGIALGALGGYLYYHFIGCNSGTCAITSKPLNSTLYGALMGGLFFNIFRKEKKKLHNMDIEKLIIEDNCTILDVRSPEEYNYGHVPGSVNIPLGEIVARMDEIKSLKKPLVLCCASGARSGNAAEYLEQHDIDCCNGGSWIDLNFNKLKSA